jgi:hypothetical protein
VRGLVLTWFDSSRSVIVLSLNVYFARTEAKEVITAGVTSVPVRSKGNHQVAESFCTKVFFGPGDKLG